MQSQCYSVSDVNSIVYAIELCLYFDYILTIDFNLVFYLLKK